MEFHGNKPSDDVFMTWWYVFVVITHLSPLHGLRDILDIVTFHLTGYYPVRYCHSVHRCSLVIKVETDGPNCHFTRRWAGKRGWFCHIPLKLIFSFFCQTHLWIVIWPTSAYQMWSEVKLNLYMNDPNKLNATNNYK